MLFCYTRKCRFCCAIPCSGAGDLHQYAAAVADAVAAAATHHCHRCRNCCLPIPDAGMTWVAELQHLRKLDLSYTQVTMQLVTVLVKKLFVQLVAGDQPTAGVTAVPLVSCQASIAKCFVVHEPLVPSEVCCTRSCSHFLVPRDLLHGYVLACAEHPPPCCSRQVMHFPDPDTPFHQAYSFPPSPQSTDG